MKKLISLLLAMLLALSLTYCGVPQDPMPENPTEDPGAITPPEDNKPVSIDPFLSHRITLAENSPFQIALAGKGDPQWDRLIDLSDESLGVSQLSLSLGLLLLTEDGKLSENSPLQLGTQNAQAGVYHPDVQKFLIDSGLGVRALGLASGITDREKDYKDATTLAEELSIQAKNAAILSMNTYGSTLANIVVKKATQPNALYAAADIDALKGMVNSLLAVDGSLAYIEQAYMQYILGYVASAAVQNSVDAGKTDADSAWHLLRAMVTGEGASLVSVKTTLSAIGITLPAELNDRIAAFEATKASVLSAQTKLIGLETKAEYAWADISSAVLDLANVDAVEVNGHAASDVMQHMDEILASMMADGLNVNTKTGGGVYADIADHCGNYKVTVTIAKIPYGGLVLSNVPAVMNATSQIDDPYLLSGKSVLEAAGAPLGSNTLKSTSAYIFDFVLRTSGTNKDLRLQTGDIALAEDGKSISAQSTFAFTSDTLNTATMKSMIDCVRIVFFDTRAMTVLATAKPDANGAYVAENSVIAGLQLLSSDAPIVTISANDIAHISVLVYVDVDAVESKSNVAFDTFSWVDSALQLQFSDTVK